MQNHSCWVLGLTPKATILLWEFQHPKSLADPRQTLMPCSKLKVHILAPGCTNFRTVAPGVCMVICHITTFISGRTHGQTTQCTVRVTFAPDMCTILIIIFEHCSQTQCEPPWTQLKPMEYSLHCIPSWSGLCFFMFLCQFHLCWATNANPVSSGIWAFSISLLHHPQMS